MPTSILFYGNCQIGALKQVLNLDPALFFTNYIACHSTKMDKSGFTSLIKTADVVITQHIRPNYRKLDYLHTDYVINNAANCKIIIFSVCYFDFYYPDLKYKTHKNTPLNKPVAYHYQHMIDNYNNNGSIDDYINNYVNNHNLITKESLLERAHNNFNELKRRDQSMKELFTKPNMYIISLTDFIEQNYKDKLLFYSMNHPTKYVIQQMCEKVIPILAIQNNIKYDIDPLSGTKCLLYKCIQSVVHFNINDHPVKTGEGSDAVSITKLYYDTYRRIDFADK